MAFTKQRLMLGLVTLGLIGVLPACSDDDDDDDTADDDDTVDDDDDDDDDTDPFGNLIDAVPTDRVPFPVDSEVVIVYDTWGVPHIYASDEADMHRGMGFAHARDRFLQMDLFRRNAKGTLSEVAGEVAVDTDYDQRRKGLWRAALDSLPVHSDPLIAALENYSEGVNATLDILRDDPVLAGRLGIRISPVYPGVGQTAADIADWEPIDSIAFGKLMAFSLSDDSGSEIAWTRAMQAYRQAFEGTPYAEMFTDAFRVKTSEPTSIIEGFPGGGTQARSARIGPMSPGGPRLGAGIPPISGGLLDAALEALADPLWGYDPVRDPGQRGSNNWMVSGEHSANGKPLLANDPHLGLDYPPNFYEMHVNDRLLRTEGTGRFNAIGVNFPGTPGGVIIGHNENVAWGVTTFGPDVSDVWRETYTPGETPTVFYNSQAVAVEQRPEVFRFPNGEGGFDEITRIVEVVPHHGIILSKDEASGEALSWRWSGHTVPSAEIDAFYGASQAANQTEFEEAVDHFRVGAQCWVSVFSNGDIFFTGESYIPTRSEDAMSAESPPWLVMPGEGGYEWVGQIPEPRIPHALNPEKGYIVTANNDAVGALYDGDPLNDDYYLMASNDEGFRAYRITERITEVINAGGKHTPESMMDIQGDHRSPLGIRFTPALLAAIEADPEGLASGDPRVAQARTYLEDWADEGYQSHSGLEAGASLGMRRAAVATSIFNAWLKRAFAATFNDERTRVQELTGHYPRMRDERTFDALIRSPETLAVDAALYWDNIVTEDKVETRELIMVDALISALDFLSTTTLFTGNGQPEPDMDQWLWGKLHRLTFDHLTADLDDSLKVLSLPPNDAPGFPRPGDISTIDVADHGMNPERFTYGSGPNIRFVFTFDEAGNAVGNIALPGGNSDTLGDPHRGDQIDLWTSNGYHKQWFELEEVKANSERIFILTPP